MSDIKSNFLLFFDRPAEPCFMQKGKEKAVFNLPKNYYPDKYKSASATLANKFESDSNKIIKVKDTAIPNISYPLELPYNEKFSTFVPKHRAMAKKLIEIFMGVPDLEDLQSICSYCQMRINPFMFVYCLTVALMHRDDTKGINIPSLIDTFPDIFMDPRVIHDAREVSSLEPVGKRVPVVIPQDFTAAEWDPEQRLAYFREDIGVNLHHWHWHLVYPIDVLKIDIVNKNRRGELFYYMHQQIIARYTAERNCNGLSAAKQYNDFSDVMEEGYFPKLDTQVASRNWPPRFAGSKIHNLARPTEQIHMDVYDMEKWRENLLQAIEQLTVMLPDGRKVPLDEETGIDILGNLIEASSLSLNRSYYGDYHNSGHLFISYCHDPDDRNLESFGVMGATETAMRDPIFYRWHTHINEIFQLYKNKLPPYPANGLDFPGIQVSSVSTTSRWGIDHLSTQWENSTLQLDNGLDFAPRGSMLASFTHLQHDDYQYVINVNNTTGADATGTVRIFMAPVSDERGRPLSFDEQRQLMIELDKFTQALPKGTSIIHRKSVDSSVTIPFERTFGSQGPRPSDSGSALAFDFCGCGWPHHLLIPKGTKQGYPVVLFCMISNWKDDKVGQDQVGKGNNAASYCGLRDRMYPDRRAMGYPFDRPFPASSLQEFLTPNMALKHCIIQFTDSIKNNPKQ